MQRVLLLSLILLFVAGTAYSQAGSIVVAADAAGTVCDIVDGGSLVQVHYLHTNHSGATASQWMLDLGGVPWIHLGDLISFPTVIGTTVAGISIGYGGCLSAPTYLGSSNFFGSNAPACSTIQIVADPASLSGEIEGVDCATPANKTYPTGWSAYINGDENCSCGASPVETATWGGVKALYR